MPRIAVNGIADILLNSMRQISLAGRSPIALYHLPDGFFATDDQCSHGEACLTEGEIEDGEIICPFHLGRFDIRTGEPTAAPCVVAVRTYPVHRADDGSLMIDIP